MHIKDAAGEAWDTRTSWWAREDQLTREAPVNGRPHEHTQEPDVDGASRRTADRRREHWRVHVSVHG